MESKGIINNASDESFLAACIVCNERKPVMLYAHRIGDLVVGWVFVCVDDEKIIRGAEISIKA